MYQGLLMEDKQMLCLSQNSSFLVPEADKPDYRVWEHRRMPREAAGCLVYAQALGGCGSWGATGF